MESPEEQPCLVQPLNQSEYQKELLMCIGTNIKHLQLRKQEIAQGQENVKEQQAVFDRHCYRAVHNLQQVLKDSLKNIKKTSEANFRQTLNRLAAAKTVVNDKIVELQELEKAVKLPEGENVPQLEKDELANLLSSIPSMQVQPELPCQSVLDAIQTLQLRFVAPGEIQMPSELPPPKLEEGGERSIYVSSRIKDGTFWAVVAPEEDVLTILNQMSLCIRDRYVHNICWQTCEETGSKPAVGDFVYARFPADNKWYRARIIDVSSLITVVYLDYGNTHTVKLDQIIIPEEDLFKSCAYQAFECAVFEEPPETLPLDVRFRFNEMVMAVDVSAKFVRQIDWNQDRTVWFTELSVMDQKGSLHSVNEEVLKAFNSGKQGQSSISCRDVRLMENPSLQVREVVERPKDEEEPGEVSVETATEHQAEVPPMAVNEESSVVSVQETVDQETADALPSNDAQKIIQQSPIDVQSDVCAQSEVVVPAVEESPEGIDDDASLQNEASHERVNSQNEELSRDQDNLQNEASVCEQAKILIEAKFPDQAHLQNQASPHEQTAQAEVTKTDSQNNPQSSSSVHIAESLVPSHSEPAVDTNEGTSVDPIICASPGNPVSEEHLDESRELSPVQSEEANVVEEHREDPGGCGDAFSPFKEVARRKVSITSSEGSDRIAVSTLSGEDTLSCSDGNLDENVRRRKKKSRKSREKYKEEYPDREKSESENDKATIGAEETISVNPKEDVKVENAQNTEVKLKVRVLEAMEVNGEFSVQLVLTDQENVHFTELEAYLQSNGHLCVREWYDGCGTNIVLANDNSTWRRARVQEGQAGKKRVSVRYLDHGRKGTLSVASLKLMEGNFSQLMTVSPRAMWCILHGWTKTVADQLEKVKSEFRNLTTGRTLSLSVIDQSREPHVVRLLDETDPSNVIDIARQICGACHVKDSPSAAEFESRSLSGAPGPQSVSVNSAHKVEPQEQFPSVSHWVDPGSSPNNPSRQTPQYRDKKKRPQVWKSEDRNEFSNGDTRSSVLANGSSAAFHSSESRNVLCYQCGEKGHIRSQCQQGRDFNSDGYMRKEKGYARRPPGLELSEIRCFICNELGHYRNHCPQELHKRLDRGGNRRQNAHKGGQRPWQRENPTEDWD